MTQDPDAPNNARLLSMQKWYRSIEQDGQICVSEGYPTIQPTRERESDHDLEAVGTPTKENLLKRRGCDAVAKTPKRKQLLRVEDRPGDRAPSYSPTSDACPIRCLCARPDDSIGGSCESGQFRRPSLRCKHHSRRDHS